MYTAASIPPIPMIRNIAVPMSPVFGRVKPLRLMMVSVIVPSVVVSFSSTTVTCPVAPSPAANVDLLSECFTNVLFPSESTVQSSVFVHVVV